MRLKEIESYLQQVDFQKVRLSVGKLRISDRELSNINAFKEFLNIIKKVDIYDDEINLLLESDLYSTTKDNLFTEDSRALNIYNTAKYLVDSTSSLNIVFKKLLPQSNEQSISIKLPEPSDFEALNKTMVTVQKSISQIISNDKIKGTTNINHWEFGSFWIELILGTEAAVALIASSVWAAAVISKKFSENKLFEQQARAMEIKNESLEDILETQKELTNQLLANEAQSVLDEHFDNNKDNEQLERLKLSIKTFATLIQNGAEIHPSIMAPEKVQNLFPNYKNIDMLTSRIKQIEDKHAESV